MGEEKLASGEMSEDEFVERAFVILQKKVERLKQENAILAPKAEVFDMAIADKRAPIGRFVRGLEGADRLNLNKVKASLGCLGYLYRKGSCWRVYREHTHLFEERVWGDTGTYEIFPTSEGKTLLVKLIKQDMLILKGSLRRVA